MLSLYRSVRTQNPFPAFEPSVATTERVAMCITLIEAGKASGSPG
jgi:hypothetical protein